MTDGRPELSTVIATALRAELARQWGNEFANYVNDINWPLMAHAALNAREAHYRPAIGSRPVAEATTQLSRVVATAQHPIDPDRVALSFVLCLLDMGWHPHGRDLLEQRNTLFHALNDALQSLHDAGGDIDDAAVQRISTAIEKVADASGR